MLDICLCLYYINSAVERAALGGPFAQATRLHYSREGCIRQSVQRDDPADEKPLFR